MKLSRESKLLKYIFRYYGGYTEIANRYNISRQYVFSWVQKGAVPPKRVRAMAKDLKVPAAALNYKALCEMNIDPPDFSNVVKIVKHVLK